MGTWNHRVIEHEENGEKFYQIHEVYYDDAGKLMSWTADAVAPFGDTLDELCDEVTMKFSRACFKPALRIIGDTLQELPPKNLAAIIAFTKEIFGGEPEVDTSERPHVVKAAASGTVAEIVAQNERWHRKLIETDRLSAADYVLSLDIS